MKSLTSEGQQQINAIAQNYGLSKDAVMNMLQAVVNGGGRMAQFNINELGGGGQWMQGGMTMVGDMFNYSLKNTVNNLCQELSNLISNQNIFVNVPLNSSGNYSFSGNWWPAELGNPSSSGAQNNIKYAFFPPPVARLATEINGEVSVYNTLDHNISGVSQQQGSGFSVLFSSQYGYVDVLNLPLVAGKGTVKNSPAPAVPLQGNQEPARQPETPLPVNQDFGKPSEMPNNNNNNTNNNNANNNSPAGNDADIFNKIDRLAELFNKGVLSESEFSAKKTELLSRL